MPTRTIVARGKVIAEGVMFSWWLTDGPNPTVTVSNAQHGSDTQPARDGAPRVQARALAKALLAKGAPSRSAPAPADREATTMPDHAYERTVVLGDDYRREIEGDVRNGDEGSSQT